MKIKVIHTPISQGTTQESNFNSRFEFDGNEEVLGSLEPNIVANPNCYLALNPTMLTDYTHEVFDRVLEMGKEVRKKEMRVGLEAIELVGHFNRFKPDGTVLSIITNPSFGGIINGLVTGAPKSVRGLIVSFSTELYNQEEKDQIYALLDPVIAEADAYKAEVEAQS